MNEIILEIVSRAETLHERIEHKNALGKPELSDIAKARLQEWKGVCALNEEEIFERRLVNDDVRESEILHILSETTNRHSVPLPEWALKFDQILEYLLAVDYYDVKAETRFLLQDEEFVKVPFPDLLVPFVNYGVNDLQTRAGKSLDIVGNNIVTLLKKQLLFILSANTAQTFYLEFLIFRTTRQSSLERLIAIGKGEPGTTLYDEFVCRLYQGRWMDFFREYSALAKIIALTVENWVGNTVKLLSRLIMDMDKIKDHFSPQNPLGKVEKISGGLSDSHNHGERVSIISFENGLKIVYKPKELALESAYSNLLDWVNKSGEFPVLKPLDVLTGDDYGWVGFVEFRECESEEQIRNYYRRVGMLICLIYALKGNDCHYENLIACGEFPVIIDLETIMHHTAKGLTGEDVESATYLAYEQFGDSVFKTGLLPSWNAGKDDYSYDPSGTGAEGLVLTPYYSIEWKHINNDLMNASFNRIITREFDNIPRIATQKYLPSSFEVEITEGFTRLYRYLMANMEKVPLVEFEEKDVRFIFRSTRIYALILKKLLNPRYMRLGVDRTIQMEGLSRAFLHQDGKNDYWNIFKSEIRQMEYLDIPIFTANSSGKDIRTEGEIVVKDFMNGPILEEVKKKIYLLDENDLNIQIKFIRASLFFENYDEGVNAVSDQTARKQVKIVPPCSREQLIEASKKIGGQIIENAILSVDSSASWITVGTLVEARKLQMRPMSLTLHDGISGVALYLGALFKVTGEERYREMAYAAIASIRKSLRIMDEYTLHLKLYQIGITAGLTSIMYTLVLLSEYLDDPDLTGEAELLAGKISADFIKSGTNFDIISGSAGAILGFIKLYRQTQNPGMREKAKICGDHLIHSRTIIGEGICGWPFLGGKILAGFSHGVAGIAYSLLCLYELTKDERYFDIAEEAIRYEDSLYVPDNKNWMDLRSLQRRGDPGKPQFMVSWCHGAPGIGLGRLASRHLLNNDQTSFDINTAIETTRNYPVNSVDHLCCGNLGRADILLYASQKLNAPEFKTMALKIATSVIQNENDNGYYSLYDHARSNIQNFGFFQGLSGIGYEFLRLACPEIIRSVLIFE